LGPKAAIRTENSEAGKLNQSANLARSKQYKLFQADCGTAMKMMPATKLPKK